MNDPPFKLKDPNFQARIQWGPNNYLGSGSFGNVYKCKLKLEHNSKFVDAAVKEIILDSFKHRKMCKKEIQNSIEIWKEINNERIIRFYDVAYECNDEGTEGKVYVFSEFANDQTVKHVIDRESKCKGLKLKKLLDWMVQICEGFHFLHTRPLPIIHRDMKPDNILIHNGNILIGDFDFIKAIDCMDANISSGGALPYTAPELMSSEMPNANYVTHADIYALGLVFGEMVLCKLDLTIRNIRCGEVLSKPSKCPKMLWELIKRCIKRNPEERPSAKILLRDIKQIKDQMNNNLEDFVWDIAAAEKVEEENVNIPKEETEYANNLITLASGGLLLRGLLENKPMEPLLQLNKNIPLKGPIGNIQEKIDEFYDEESEQKLHDKVNTFGIGQPEESSFRLENTGSSHRYYSKVHYIAVPVCSCNINESDVVIHDLALDELEDIDRMLGMGYQRDGKANLLCQRFIERYGSYIVLGDVSFGGLFMHSVHSKKLDKSKERIEMYRKKATRMIEKVIDNLEFEQSQEYSFGDADDGILMNTTISRRGGSKNTMTVADWKRNLTFDDNNLAVIEREIDKIVPVWDIVCKQNAERFDNPKTLASLLHRCSQEMTETKLNLSNLIEIDICIRKCKHMVNECIPQWEKEGNYKKDNLNKIIKLRNEIENIQKEDSFWVNHFLSFESIQQYLQLIKDNHNLSVEAKTLMRHIISPADASYLDSVNFQRMKPIYDWSEDKNEFNIEDVDQLNVKTIEELLKVIRRGVDNIVTEAGEKSRNQRIEYEVKRASCYLRVFCKTLTNSPEDISFRCLLYRFGYSLSKWRFSAGAVDIDIFKKLEEHVKGEIGFRAKLKKYTDVSKSEALVILKFLQSKYDPFSTELCEQDFITENIVGLLKSIEVKTVIFSFDVNLNEERRALLQELREIEKHGHFSEVKPSPLSIEYSERKLKLKENVPQMHDNVVINPQVVSILQRTGLSKYYPRRITCDDVFRSADSVYETPKPKQEGELGIYFLKQLQMFNHKVHQNLVIDEGGQKPDKHSDKNAFKSKKKETETMKPTKDSINPLDIEIVAFLSCNPIAQQEFVRRLWECKLAIPFIIQEDSSLPSLFIWPLEDLSMHWEPRGQCLITQEYMKCFSFIRFGKLDRSKSNIVNEIFFHDSHQMFFNRSQQESKLTEKILEGFIDIGWKLPTDQAQDQFKEPTLIANLHGDARECESHVSLLARMSTNLVIFSTAAELDSNSPGLQTIIRCAELTFVYIIVVDEKLSDQNRKIVCEMCEALDGLDLGEKYDILALDGKDITQLISHIRENLQEPNNDRKTSLQDAVLIGNDLSFFVDVEKDPCKKGIKEAKKIFKKLQSRDPMIRKESVLPTQGHYWQMWCKVDREARKLANKTDIAKLTAKLENRKKLYRSHQFHKIKEGKIAEEMITFLDVLFNESNDVKSIFLRQLKTFLDDLSRIEISKFQVHYQNSFLRLDEAKDLSQRKGVAAEIGKLDIEMAERPIGLEHFLREIGQIYESSISQNTKDYEDISNGIRHLPKLAVELLLNGYPIEIMDGTTGAIPQTWVSAVLDELDRATRDCKDKTEKKCLILSVIGIQSSGKSTLLNTMFGLQFAVSAGRCSKGVYFQLINTSKAFLEDTGIHYALVIDTEGLRSPEKNSESSRLRDNELVTFVTGISNITLVNVMGENICILDEILPITVLAFLRMKITKNTQPRCLLVHQNVHHLANKDLKPQEAALEKRLDEHTEAACKFQSINVLQFKEVITFNARNDATYINAFQEGEPPMAYISTGYSKNVAQLKKKTLEDVKLGRAQTIQQVKINIQNLNEAIFRDDFVYNFRNILEIQARGKLDEYWCELNWKLRLKIKELQSSAYVSIMNCENPDELFKKENNFTQYNNSIDKCARNLENELEMFFEMCEENLQSYVQTWKESSKSKLKDLTEKLKDEFEKEVKSYANTRRMQQHIDKNVKNYEKHIMADIAKIVKGNEQGKDKKEKLSESEDMRSLFEAKWLHWISEIFKNHEFVKPNFSMIEKDADDALRRHFPKDGSNIASKLHHKRIIDYIVSDFFITERHYTDEWFKKAQVSNFWDPPIKRLEQLAQDVYQRVSDMLEDENIKNNPYNNVTFDTILKEIKNATLDQTHFTTEFYIDLSFVACGNAVRKLHEFNEKFNELNNPRFRIEQNKENFYSIFLHRFKKIEAELILSGQIVDLIFRGIEKRLENDLPAKIANDMKIHTHVNVFSSKTAFVKDMLKEYINFNDFQKFSYYLNFPVTAITHQVKMKVTEWSLRYESRLDKGEDFIKDAAQKLVIQSFDGVTSAFQSIQVTTNANFKTYLQLLQKTTEGHLILGETEKVMKIAEQITKDNEKIDFEFMVRNIKEGLNDDKRILEIRNKFLEFANSGNSTKLQYSIIERVGSFLKDSVIGCTECCPFCGEICKSGMPDHEGLQHTTPLHRPKGVCGFRDPMTNKLVVDTCTRSMADDTKFRNSETKGELVSFRNYRSVCPRYASWDIASDLSLQAAKYWKWFMAQFNSNLAIKWNVSMGDVPLQWSLIDKETALKELDRDLYF